MDHAAVSWPVGAARPTTKHVHDDIAVFGWGAFWGPLFGMLLAFPVVGAAASAAVGAFARTRAGVGNADEQLGRIRAESPRGRRPVLVTEQANLDRLSWRAAAAQRERGLRRHPERV